MLQYNDLFLNNCEILWNFNWKFNRTFNITFKIILFLSVYFLLKIKYEQVTFYFVKNYID